MSWRATLSCSRAQGEAIAEADGLFDWSDTPPVVVVDEPDASSPDDWLIHAYFEQPPNEAELALLGSLGRGTIELEQLGEADWVSMSQEGLTPIRAGRFYVHTPMHRSAPPGSVAFEIDAGLAFGTGQHATTRGCLLALDRLDGEGTKFRNVADIGTGTGLLAFAALALWPDARCLATDIDPIAIEVSQDNAAINRVRLGHEAGELILAVADGMESPFIEARAPFDLIIANILAGPLLDLAPAFAQALAPSGTIILAGLLDTQAAGIIETYEGLGLVLKDVGSGEWPVLVLTNQESRQLGGCT